MHCRIDVPTAAEHLVDGNHPQPVTVTAATETVLLADDQRNFVDTVAAVAAAAAAVAVVAVVVREIRCMWNRSLGRLLASLWNYYECNLYLFAFIRISTCYLFRLENESSMW